MGEYMHHKSFPSFPQWGDGAALLHLAFELDALPTELFLPLK